MYSWSPNLNQISLKNFFGKVVFKFLPKSKWREKKIGYLAAILKRYKYFIFFSWNMVVISVCIYGIKIIKKFRCESGFLKGGSMEPPYALTEVQGTLCNLGRFFFMKTTRVTGIKIGQTFPNLVHILLFIIIIIYRLGSRRPQGFSMHNDHQQMRQSAVHALLLHYPQAIFVHN